jgi:hypothetical protein
MNAVIQALRKRPDGNNNLSMPERGIIRFLNIYYPVTFAIIFCLGVVMWRHQMPHKEIIPIAIIFYAVSVFPRMICREIVSYGTILFYPFVAILNEYNYMIAMSCWYPVLINAFIIALANRSIRFFCVLCAVHIVGLVAITVVLLGARTNFWFLAPVTNIMACAVLILAFRLFQRNRDLMKNLEALFRIVRHDLGNWTNLLVLGRSISKKKNIPINDLIEEGITGLHGWTLRLQGKAPFNIFAFLEIISIDRFIGRLETGIAGIVPLSIACDGDLKKKEIRTDCGILVNCLLNLVRNAEQAGASKVEILFVQGTGKTCTLQIKDNGRGIARETAVSLFKERISSRAGEGSGYGLLGVKYHLSFLDCTIELTDPNPDGTGQTIFTISGIIIC